jgi:hypothetical protein
MKLERSELGKPIKSYKKLKHLAKHNKKSFLLGGADLSLPHYFLNYYTFSSKRLLCHYEVEVLKRDLVTIRRSPLQHLLQLVR